MRVKTETLGFDPGYWKVGVALGLIFLGIQLFQDFRGPGDGKGGGSLIGRRIALV